MPWKSLITWGSSLLLIAGFLWKMGMLRSIPSFAGSLLNVVPVQPIVKAATQAVTETPQSIPKSETLQMSYAALIENPIGVLGIAIGATGLLFGMTMLKLTVAVLRKLPK